MTKIESQYHIRMDEQPGGSEQPVSETEQSFSTETKRQPDSESAHAPASNLPWEDSEKEHEIEDKHDDDERALPRTDTPSPSKTVILPNRPGQFVSKLTEKEWKEAQHMWEHQKMGGTAIGNLFGVNASTIQNRASRKGWSRDLKQRKKRDQRIKERAARLKREESAVVTPSIIPVTPETANIHPDNARIVSNNDDIMPGSTENKAEELKARALDLGNIAYRRVAALVERMADDIEDTKKKFTAADLKSLASAIKDLREASIGKQPSVGISVGNDAKNGVGQAILAVPFLPGPPIPTERAIDVVEVAKEGPPDPFAV